MATDSMFREYENGIADVVEFLVGDHGKVRRNVFLKGFDSKIMRQIDILVEGLQFGIYASKLIIDCKKYSTKLDVNDIPTFAAMVEDVRATSGWLVTTQGYSMSAKNIAEKYRGLDLHVMSLEELLSWRPKGTAFAFYAVKSEAMLEKAAKALREKGFRARVASPEEAGSLKPDEHLLEAFRYYKPAPDGGLSDNNIIGTTAKVLTEAGIAEFRHISNGVVFGGGTPGHRYLEILAKGQPTGLKINVSNDTEVRDHISDFERNGMFASGGLFAGLTSEDLDVRRPDVWPIKGLFPDRLGLQE